MMRKLLIAVAILCSVFIAALTACSTLSHHTASPYDRDAAAALRIEREAADWCAEHGRPAGPPTLPFRFDGCSLFPDGDWRDCCQTHDYAYWCGGSAADRALADDALNVCVAEKKGLVLGGLMWLGVRAGGHPALPMYFRWGHGHEYAGCYPESSEP